MSLQYKVMTTFKPGAGKTGETISFPKLRASHHMNLRDVAKTLAKRSSLGEGDVYSVIVGLVQFIPDALLDGYTIKLDGLGSFRLHAKVATAASPEEVNLHHIKGLRISFLPDKEMKNVLNTSQITKAKSKKG